MLVGFKTVGALFTPTSDSYMGIGIAFGVILSISKIASKRIAKETLNADPLVDRTQEVTAIEHDLSDLDDFESGNITEDELNDEDYGI